MQTPLLLGTSSTAAPALSSDRYCPFAAGSANSCWDTTYAAAATPIAASGTISKLSICFPATGTGTYAVTLYVNGSATALSCTVNLATSSLASDSANSVTVNAGDRVAWQVHPVGPPTGQTVVQISSVFTGSVSGESVIFGGSEITGLNADKFLSFGSLASGATAVSAGVLVPTTGTIDRLYVNLSTAPTAGNSYAFTIYKNGVATAVTCTISDAATSASDLSNSLSVVAGDRISLFADATGTPATVEVRFGARFLPTTDGESILLSHWTAVPTAGNNRYSNLHGAAPNQSVESNTYNLAPIDFTAKSLYIEVETAPGASQTRSIWVRKGASGALADTALTATISGTGTAASDTADTVSVTNGDFLSLRTNSTASAASPTSMRASAVAFITPTGGGGGNSGAFFMFMGGL